MRRREYRYDAITGNQITHYRLQALHAYLEKRLRDYSSPEYPLAGEGKNTIETFLKHQYDLRINFQNKWLYGDTDADMHIAFIMALFVSREDQKRVNKNYKD